MHTSFEDGYRVQDGRMKLGKVDNANRATGHLAWDRLYEQPMSLSLRASSQVAYLGKENARQHAALSIDEPSTDDARGVFGVFGLTRVEPHEGECRG